jgi:FkbM family methyltransferase
MKQLLDSFLARISGNARAQKLLEMNIDSSQLLMGIGSGAGVNSSGEKVLVKELRQSYSEAKQPLCVFDVGANKGQFLDLIADGLQDIPFNIHAFEPSRHTYNILSENTVRRSNIMLNNFGLGKERGEFALFYNETGSGLASLSKRRLDHFGIDFNHSEQVKIEILDEYCSNNLIQYIDLLKLDVEGHELDVLNGGIKMFQRKLIRMVSFEFGGCNIDTRTYFQDFWYFFKENGMFNIYRITPSGYLMPLDKYKELYEQFRTTNYLAILKE